jgi:Ca2+-binding RTX toxin-like protein
MRRTVLLIAVVAMGLLLVSGVAWAANVQCKANKTCVGTNQPDNITGTNKADTINALGGNDVVNAGRGKDLVRGGGGNDKINIADGQADRVDCGPGNNDEVTFDVELDKAAKGTPKATGNCEVFHPVGGASPDSTNTQLAQ